MFLNIYCKKVLNSNSKQILSYILEIDFLIQTMQQVLLLTMFESLLEAILSIVLLLRDAIALKIRKQTIKR